MLHYTAMATAEAAVQRLCDPAAEVSAHYLIAEDGAVVAMVPEAERAWHAGAGRWGGCTDVNSASIGIELANAGPMAGFPPYPEPQMTALERLLGAVMARWDIAPAGVIAHSDTAPARKADPGPKFDWRRLARSDLSIWPEPGAAEADPDRFRSAAIKIGYDPGLPLALALAAFRLRFRPGAGGPLESVDVAAAESLAQSYPFIDLAPVPT